MQAPVQRVTGAVGLTGPQPVNPASVEASVASSEALGALADTPAATVSNTSINAKLGAIMFSLGQIVQLLEVLVVHVKESADADRQP